MSRLYHHAPSPSSQTFLLEQVKSESKAESLIAKAKAYTSMAGGALLWHLDHELGK